MVSVHFMTTRTEIGTPQSLYKMLDSEFHFSLDVCASHENAKCQRYFTKEQDCLILKWSHETCFMNPPYGRQIARFIKKAYTESLTDNTTVVCLLPSRTDTVWWHEYVMRADEVRFIKGRLTFENEIDCAPFPSAIVVFRDHISDVKFSSMIRG